jgi:drug/metabolite transporter (DMT)-like permease
MVLLPRLIKKRRKIKTLTWKDRFAIAWISFFGGLLGTYFITKAFFLAYAGQVTLATVVILQKLQPVFALALARIVLKEKLKPQFYLRALVAIGA